METECASRLKLLAVNDDEDYCCCCGRQGLKRVVWIEDLETGAVSHFGTTCATKRAPALFGEIKETERAYLKGIKAAKYKDYRAAYALASKQFHDTMKNLYEGHGGGYIKKRLHSGLMANLPSDTELMADCHSLAKAMTTWPPNWQ